MGRHIHGHGLESKAIHQDRIAPVPQPRSSMRLLAHRLVRAVLQMGAQGLPPVPVLHAPHKIVLAHPKVHPLLLCYHGRGMPTLFVLLDERST
jgi:hypothetical protein